MNKEKYKNPVSATFNGILDLFRKQTPIGTLLAEDRLEGKNCLITGANSGLGYAVAQQMAERGGNIYMACRSGIPEAGKKIKALSNNPQVQMLPIDLSDIDSIYRFIEDIKQKNIQFDIAVFNAAMVPKGAKKTKSGFDEMFLVNYLSKFILVNGLIAANAFVKGKSRLIFVNSESHRTNTEINFEKLGVYEEYTMGKVIHLYGYYKLLLNTFATELSKKHNIDTLGYSIFSLCPGPINSNIARSAPKAFMPLLKLIFKLFFNSPEKAAQPVMYLACSLDVEGKTDIYLHLMQQKEMDPKALDMENGNRLWEKSAALINDLS